MRRHHFVLDLKDDPDLIAKYDEWHRPEKVWPAIVESIAAAGIIDLQIFRAGNRLVMMMETKDSFDPAANAVADSPDSNVQAWEALMWTYQQSLPFAKPGEKWVPMTRIFSLHESLVAHNLNQRSR
jgi:L-rhamnose mutarotase